MHWFGLVWSVFYTHPLDCDPNTFRILDPPMLDSLPAKCKLAFRSIMSKTTPSQAVKQILTKYNVDIKEYVSNHLDRFASKLLKQELVEVDAERKVRVPGLDPFRLAAELISACHPSLEQFPEKNFPKFIAVMQDFANMKELAKKMKDEYEQKSMSRSTFDIS